MDVEEGLFFYCEIVPSLFLGTESGCKWVLLEANMTDALPRPL